VLTGDPGKKNKVQSTKLKVQTAMYGQQTTKIHR
jgi:hypothetical protein